MGNRAFIRFEGEDVGMYLHWNGGRDSVEAFLDYCKLKGYRADDYGIARMLQVIGNFFGGELSVGVQSTKGKTCFDLDPGDNGVYTVKNWEIVGRYPENVHEQNSYDRIEFMISLDKAQPESEQIGEDKIREFIVK